MPPIPEQELVTVSLDYLKAYNLAARGSVEFTPPRFTLADGTVVVTTPVVAAVVGGVGTVGLIPTDSGTYLVREMLDGRPAREWHINLSEAYAGQAVALSSFLPATPVQPGVTVNTLLSGTAAPGALTGHDGDYYYDVVAKRWYGPKAGGTWPAGFSVVGPQGQDGDDGSDGADGASGAPAHRLVRVRDTSKSGEAPGSQGYAIASTGDAWALLPDGPEYQIVAAAGEDVEATYGALVRNPSNWAMDLVVVTGPAPAAGRYLTTGTVTPAVVGNPGNYPEAIEFEGRVGTLWLNVQPGDLDGGVLRLRWAIKSSGVGLMHASTSYPLLVSLRNSRTPAV